MLREMLVHLEHGAAVLAEDLLQLVVCEDLPLVLRILEIVLADVVPDLADDLAARQRVGARNRGEVRRRLHRTLQPALTICHYCLPVVFVRPIERNSPLLAMGAERRNGLVSRRLARFLWIEASRGAARPGSG